jgi:hypothetical protein
MDQDQLVALLHGNNERHRVAHQLLVHHRNPRQNELYTRTKLHINRYFFFFEIFIKIDRTSTPLNNSLLMMNKPNINV